MDEILEIAGWISVESIYGILLIWLAKFMGMISVSASTPEVIGVVIVAAIIFELVKQIGYSVLGL